MQPLWYVLRSKPRKEDSLWRHAVCQGFSIFYPRIPVKTVNPRARKVVPYFPGYMFVRVILESVGLATFQYMPHAHGLICFDNCPAPVSDELIAAIAARVEAIGVAGSETLLGLQRGDTVTIQAGPFAGYEAIFDGSLNGNERVRVLLALLNEQSVPLTLSTGQIKPRR